MNAQELEPLGKADRSEDPFTWHIRVTHHPSWIDRLLLNICCWLFLLYVMAVTLRRLRELLARDWRDEPDPPAEN